MSDTDVQHGLWRYSGGNKSAKYLVQRRDGTVPEWPNFVLGAKDPAAGPTLRFYALTCEKLGYDPQYVSDLFKLADEFSAYLKEHGAGDPDRSPRPVDNPDIVSKFV